MKQRISMGNGGQAIIITNLEFDEDGFGTDQKAGLLPVDIARDQTELLEKASKYVWKLHGQKNIQGFFSVKKERPLTAEELAKQDVSINGRSVVNSVDAKEASSMSVSDFISHETNTGSRINQPSLLER